MSNYQTLEDFLKHYDPKKYVTPDGYTSDIAVFTIIAENKDESVKAPPKRKLKIMLIQRYEKDSEGNPNVEAGKWALPGGFIKPEEPSLDAAKRHLEHETGVKDILVKHFNVYDEPKRDPRGWIISSAHYAIVNEEYLESRSASGDAYSVELFTIEEALKLDLAFDHREIINDALDLIKKEIIQTTVAKNFLCKEFTLSELRDVLLAVVSYPTIEEKSVFFKKTPMLPFIKGVFDSSGQQLTTTKYSFRPARLYTFIDVEPIASIYE